MKLTDALIEHLAKLVYVFFLSCRNEHALEVVIEH